MSHLLSDQSTIHPERTGVPSSAPVIEFRLPPDLEATAPPELRPHASGRRDDVRLLVLDRRTGATIHTSFRHLDRFLRAGDLLVVNRSRTVPALLRALGDDGRPVEVRLAGHRGSRRWDALLLDGRTHIGREGLQLIFGEDLRARVLGRRRDLPFLWRLEFSFGGAQLLDAIYRLGEPVRYGYVAGALPIDLYQTVYAAEPGSVEMPSAGRPLSWEILLRLRRKGVDTASLVLHTGLSSTRDDAIDALHPNYDEAFTVPSETAAAVNRTHAAGGRVIAVGTTVVRALESVTGDDGITDPGHGRTRLRITPTSRLHAVDGLLTGLHEPQASHLDMLSAFVRPEHLAPAYGEALAGRYLWHEFGDMNLIIEDTSSRQEWTMTAAPTNATDVHGLYLEALQGAMTRPPRGDAGDALQRFLTLNAAYFLGEWLAQHTHMTLVQRAAARIDGIVELLPPDDETSALQLAQHARELVAAFGPTRWTDRIIRLTEELVPAQPEAWDRLSHTALATVAAGGNGDPLLRAHARRRLWQLSNRATSAAEQIPIPPWALTYAYHAAASDDGKAIQTAEAALAELADPSLGPSPR